MYHRIGEYKLKTVRVIPQRIAIEPDGKQYSMYGSLSKGMIIKEL